MIDDNPARESLIGFLVDDPRFFGPNSESVRSEASSSDSHLSSSFGSSMDELICIEKTAILCLEFQNDFIDKSGVMYSHLEKELSRTRILNKSKKLISSARKKGVTIIHAPVTIVKHHRKFEKRAVTYGIMYNKQKANAFREGEIGSEFHEDFKPRKEDFIVREKHGPDSFYGTNLDEILQRNHIQNVAIIGLLTNCCVESTMRSAYELGYNVYTIIDCCCTTTQEGHLNAIMHTFPMFSVPLDHVAFLESLTDKRTRDPPSSIRTTRSRLIFGSAEHVCRDCAFVHLVDFFAGLPMAFDICTWEIFLPFVFAVFCEFISTVILYFLARICFIKANTPEPYKRQTATEGLKKALTTMLTDLLVTEEDNLYAQSVDVLNCAKTVNVVKCIINCTQILMIMINFFTCTFTSTGVLGVFADIMSTLYLWNIKFDKYSFHF